MEDTNLVRKYLTQSFKEERVERKHFSDNNELRRFCDFNGEY